MTAGSAVPWRCLTSKEFIRPTRLQASAGAPRGSGGECVALEAAPRSHRTMAAIVVAVPSRCGRCLRDARMVSPKTGERAGRAHDVPKDVEQVLVFVLAEANGSRCWRRKSDAAPPAPTALAGSEHQGFAPGTRELVPRERGSALDAR